MLQSILILLGAVLAGVGYGCPAYGVDDDSADDDSAQGDDDTSQPDDDDSASG